MVNIYQSNRKYGFMKQFYIQYRLTVEANMYHNVLCEQNTQEFWECPIKNLRTSGLTSSTDVKF